MTWYKFQLRPYHSAILTCLRWDAWDMWNAFDTNSTNGDYSANFNSSMLKDAIEWIDFGNLMPQLRGFS